MGFPDGIFIHALDAILLAGDDARFVEANPAACELTGYDRDELLGLSVFDLAEPDDRPGTEARWQQFLTAGRGEGTFVVRRRDGTTREVDFRAVAHVRPGIHLSVLRDVSEQRRAERAAAQRDEWIDLILEQLPAALWIVDRRLHITFARGAADLTEDLLARAPMQLEDVPSEGRRPKPGRAGPVRPRAGHHRAGLSAGPAPRGLPRRVCGVPAESARRAAPALPPAPGAPTIAACRNIGAGGRR